MALKWRIFWLYLVFGFLPLVMVFYFSVHAYTRSIENITEKQISQLVQRVAEQTETFCLQIHNDLEQLSSLPYVQSSFVEFQNSHRLNLLREKLDLFREGKKIYHGMALWTYHGELLAFSSSSEEPLAALINGEEEKMMPQDLDFFYKKHLGVPTEYLILFKRVYDFQEQMRPVGFVSARVPMRHIVTFFDRLEIGPGIEKIIRTESGDPVFVRRDLQISHGNIKEYAAAIQILNWRILLRIPEEELFKDVRLLIARNISFTTIVLILAMAASYFFSKKMITPLTEIINGTKEFAQGNLDHRIEIRSGIEVKRLSDAFNLMAKQLKERQLELIQSNKLAALGLMVAGIAHEIKNPLAGIKTTAQVMAELLTSAPKKEDNIQLNMEDFTDIQTMTHGIGEEVDRLNKIVGELLHFGKPGPSEIVLCDIERVIDHSLNILKKEIKDKKISISKQLHNCLVMADRDQMVQIFINLLLNAVYVVKPETGNISIVSRENESKAPVIVVSDNGRGIPEEKIDQIFDPFFSMSGSGTGLGLSIVYTLLSRNNARIEVTSVVGKGTEFRMTFQKYQEQERSHG